MRVRSAIVWSWCVALVAVSACGDGPTSSPCSDLETQVYLAVPATGGRAVTHGDGVTIDVETPGLVTWFTDRPRREAGVFPVGQLPEVWRALSLDRSAPLGVLGFLGDRAPDAFLVTATPEVSRGDVRVSAIPLGVGEDVPERFAHTTVFIDPAAAYRSACGTPPSAGEPQLSFALPSRSGASSLVGGATLLLLEDVGDTTWFTPTPSATYGAIDTADFVGWWAESDELELDPPNALLTVQVGSGEMLSFAVELRSPRWLSDARTLEVRASVLPQEQQDSALPREWESAVLFVDAVQTLPNEIVQSIAISNAKVVGEQPAVLANLSLSSSILAQSERQAAALDSPSVPSVPPGASALPGYDASALPLLQTRVP